MLSLTLHPAEPSLDCDRPWLVFIHGLLGDGRDWEKVLPYFRGYSCVTVDLPGHGRSNDVALASVDTEGFAQLSQLLTETLLFYNINRYILVGYSLGGRTAMYHACFGQRDGLCGLVIEGETPALTMRPSVMPG